MQYTKKRVT
ncbi:Putative uncharacterized protein [Lacticaseibacillus paracasei]|nr:Putative uncharacterized protein [Lacticaseibacillus paracasei]